MAARYLSWTNSKKSLGTCCCSIVYLRTKRVKCLTSVPLSLRRLNSLEIICLIQQSTLPLTIAGTAVSRTDDRRWQHCSYYDYNLNKVNREMCTFLWVWGGGLGLFADPISGFEEKLGGILKLQLLADAGAEGIDRSDAQFQFLSNLAGTFALT